MRWEEGRTVCLVEGVGKGLRKSKTALDLDSTIIGRRDWIWTNYKSGMIDLTVDTELEFTT